MKSLLTMAAVLLPALAVSLALPAAEPPRFSVQGIVPFRGQPGGPFAPGLVVTIYGERLAKGPCSQNPTAYAETACQAVVLAGDKPAQLLYVSTNQINLKLPDDLPKDGMVPLRVVREGISSLPVLIHLSSKPELAAAQPAYAGLPVWLAVELPYPLTGSVSYPVSFDPSDFGSNVIEIRKDGKLLPETPLGLSRVIVRGESVGIQPRLVSPADATLRNRLPLHLRYRFEEPGVYQVRYSLVYQEVVNGNRTARTMRSEWTEISILPSTPELRAAWLADMQRENPANAADLLCSFLPSLLVQRTPETFSILSRYFNHRNGFVQIYAQNVAHLFNGVVPQNRMPVPAGAISF